MAGGGERDWPPQLDASGQEWAPGLPGLPSRERAASCWGVGFQLLGGIRDSRIKGHSSVKLFCEPGRAQEGCLPPPSPRGGAPCVPRSIGPSSGDVLLHSGGGRLRCLQALPRPPPLLPADHRENHPHGLPSSQGNIFTHRGSGAAVVFAKRFRICGSAKYPYGCY